MIRDKLYLFDFILLANVIYNNVPRYNYYENTVSVLFKTICLVKILCAYYVLDSMSMYWQLNVQQGRESLLIRIDY